MNKYMKIIEIILIQSNFFLLALVYKQHNQILELNSNLIDVSDKIKLYENKLKLLESFPEKIVEKSSAIDVGTSKIIVIISFIISLYKIMGFLKSSLFFINKITSLNMIPFLISNSKIASYFFDKNEIFELEDDSFFYLVTMKNNDIEDIQIRTHDESLYCNITEYINKLLTETNQNLSDELSENVDLEAEINKFADALSI